MDTTQQNFFRLAGGAPIVSDRAAIFSIQTTPIMQGTHGPVIVAPDPFCTSPVPDMDATKFTNPGWTGNDTFPINGSTHQVIVGLNSALTASTLYYYCIEYQGYGERGSFTTAATESGTVNQGTSFAPPLESWRRDWSV